MTRHLLIVGAAVAVFLLACSGGGSGGVADGGAARDAPAGSTGDRTATTPSPDGPPAPRLELSDTDIDFGTVNIGATGVRVVVVTDTGDQPTAPLSVTMGPAADFKATNNCDGRRLGIGETCVITLQFLPMSTGIKTISGVVRQSQGPEMSRTFAGHGTGRLAPDAGLPDAGGEAGVDAGADADDARPDVQADRSGVDGD